MCVCVCVCVCVSAWRLAWPAGRPAGKRPRLETLPESAEAEVLLAMVGSGQTHAATAHLVAQASVADHGGQATAAIHAIQSLGASGSHPGNVERDLHRWTRDLWSFGLRTESVFIEAYVQPDATRRRVEIPVLPPDVVIGAILRAGSLQTIVSLTGATCVKGFSEWWATASVQPYCQHLLPLLSGRDLSRCVPLVFHEDGAEVFRDAEYYIWSWRSGSPALTLHPCACEPSHQGQARGRLAPECGCVSQRAQACRLRDPRTAVVDSDPSQHSGTEVVDVMDSQFPIAMVPMRWLATEDVRSACHRAIVGCIASSLRNLEQGRLPGGWSAIFFAWTGDLKARKEAHRFTGSYAHTFVCDSCCAQQAHQSASSMLLYQNFGDDAAHRSTRISHQTYLAANVDRLSPWVHVPGWCLELTLWDAMHVVYLGIARDHVASHLRLWTEAGFLSEGARPTHAGPSPSHHAEWICGDRGTPLAALSAWAARFA